MWLLSATYAALAEVVHVAPLHAAVRAARDLHAPGRRVAEDGREDFRPYGVIEPDGCRAGVLKYEPVERDVRHVARVDEPRRRGKANGFGADGPEVDAAGRAVDHPLAGPVDLGEGVEHVELRVLPDAEADGRGIDRDGAGRRIDGENARLGVGPLVAPKPVCPEFRFLCPLRQARRSEFEHAGSGVRGVVALLHLAHVVPRPDESLVGPTGRFQTPLALEERKRYLLEMRGRATSPAAETGKVKPLRDVGHNHMSARRFRQKFQDGGIVDFLPSRGRERAGEHGLAPVRRAPRHVRAVAGVQPHRFRKKVHAVLKNNLGGRDALLRIRNGRAHPPQRVARAGGRRERLLPRAGVGIVPRRGNMQLDRRRDDSGCRHERTS